MPELISHESHHALAPRHLVAGIALVAIGYVAGSIAPPSAEFSFGVAMGNAPAMKRMADMASGAPQSTAAASQAKAFDYFPDHYRNRATDVAPPTDTF